MQIMLLCKPNDVRDSLAGLLPRRRGPKHPHKFTEEVLAFLGEQLAAADGPPDWRELSKLIEAKFGTRVHPRSVQRAVKRKKNQSP